MSHREDVIFGIASDVPLDVRISGWRERFNEIGENQLVRIWLYEEPKPIIGTFKNLRDDTILLEDEKYRNTGRLRIVKLNQIKTVQKLTAGMILRFIATTFSNRKKPEAIVEELRRQLSEIHVEGQK